MLETMITPSNTRATMLKTVCETRVPSRTGKVSRMRPVRRASTIARAGSPSRAGRVADISTPIIVAEVTSRRRIGRLGSAARAIQNQDAARTNSESPISAQAIITQPKSDRTMLSTTFETPILLAASAVRPMPRTPATPRASRRAARRPHPAFASRLGIERRKPAGGPWRAAVGAHQANLAGDPLAGRCRLGGGDRPLIDMADLVGDPRPRIALGAAARLETHLPQPLRLVMGTLQLLGEALWIGGRDQDAVDAVADDVVVAGDVGGDHRCAGGEGLGEHHAEALAR